MHEKTLLSLAETMAMLGRCRKSIYIYRNRGDLTPDFGDDRPRYDLAEVQHLLTILPEKRGKHRDRV